ncbi:unnamed protein product [Symbiodinium necroappetens]|uniref:Uncharacterized protein n=1 Tax=Symbiodinium necroappetens TaxID=1628268 RepID=A0A813AH51_9DINO|nr:unnamed protein product [Symbiodinium necroappetens]
MEGDEQFSPDADFSPSAYLPSESCAHDIEKSWDVCSSFPVKASAADNRDTSSSSSLRSEKAIDVTVPLHQRTVALSASALALSDPVPSFAWETGFWENFFDERSAVDRMAPAFKFHRPKPAGSIEVTTQPDAEVQAPGKRPRPEGPESFLDVVKNRLVISWRDKREAEHRRALCKWSSIFDKLDGSCDPVIQSISELPETEKFNTLDDYMARKAPGTMTKRANSFLKVIKVAEGKGLRFPVTEPQLYELLQEATTGGAVPSQLRGIMETLLFARHVFGIQALHQLAISRRCWGVGAARQARAVSKAAGLRVVDLIALHRTLDSSQNVWDRLFAGCALFCVYARARWSDAQHIDTFRYDQGPDSPKVDYLEAVIDIHKNMNRRGKSPVLLELVAPGLGVASDCWIEKFLDARDSLKLSAEHAFMPAPDVTGAPTIRALDSDECSEWLVRLLPPRQGLKTTSHSLKRTLLSYCAKWGISHTDRLAMGSHSHPGRMSDEYAEDALARPLRLIEMVVKAIRSERFHPDATRAGRFEGAEPSTDPIAEPLESILSLKPAGSAPLRQTPAERPEPGSDSSEEFGTGLEVPTGAPAGSPLVGSPSFVEEEKAAEEAAPGASESSSSTETSSSDSSASHPEPEAGPARLMYPPAPPEDCRFVCRG